MKEFIIIFGILFIIVFTVLTIIRIVMTIFLLYTIRKYKELIALIRPKDKKDENQPGAFSSEDAKYRDKEKEKKKELEKLKNVQKLTRVNEEEINLEEKRIVGMVKPVGRWTAMILGQRVSYLMQHAETLKAQNSPNYWQNMIHAQEVLKGKGKNRGL